MSNELKQDINFLEYPLWSINTRPANTVIKWEDDDSFKFSCAKLPTKVDMLILYYLLLECQNNNWSDKLVLSRYQILKGCDISISQPKYKRLEQSLDIWSSVYIKYSGVFYDDKKYQSINFHIIDDWKVKEGDTKVRISLNPLWVEKIKNSHFFKYISFTQMKSLRSPLALRLYELLIKTFYNRTKWEIDIIKLGQKIPMQEKYMSDIVPKIETAVKRISIKTDLNISLKIVKQGRGKGKFIFTKKPKKVKKQLDLPMGIPDEVDFLIPDKFKKSSSFIVNQIVNETDITTLKKCIECTNSHKNIKNYGALLRTIYKQGYYKDFKPDEKPYKPMDISIDIAVGDKVELEGKKYIIEDGMVIRMKDGLMPEGFIRKLILNKKMKIVEK